jgi:hypothetical protein
MKFDTIVSYSESIVRNSVRAFWWKKLGKELYWAIPVFMVGVTIIVVSPEHWYYGAFFSLISAIAIIAILSGYFVYLRRSLALFKEMGDEKCTWIFDDDEFHVQSQIGETRLKWKALKEILKFNKFWLLVYKNGAYSTLPMAGISKECQEFIETSHNKANSADAPKARAAD